MSKIQSVVFDLYGTLFDVHTVAAKCDELFPGRGREVSVMWRQKQLEYTWLRSLMNRYVTFEEATEDALKYTCRTLGLSLDGQKADVLCEAYLHLRPYPEVAKVLDALRARGLGTAILSNGSPYTIDAVTRHAGLHAKFDHLLSVDAVHVYKPHPSVYELAEAAFKLRRESILFVSSNAWDATGARHFGFPTCWVNRAGQPFEEMGQTPNIQVPDLGGLIEQLESSQLLSR